MEDPASRMTMGARGTHAMRRTHQAVSQKLKETMHQEKVDLDEELNADLVIAHHLWRDHRLLAPLSMISKTQRWRQRWEALLVFGALYTIFMYPMRIAFDVGELVGFEAVDIFFDLCFWVDIALMFRTARLNEQYELIFERRQIARAYMRERFYVDVLSALPIDYFTRGARHRALLQTNRLLRVSRLLPAKVFGSPTAEAKAVTVSAAWVRIFLDFRNLFFFAHWTACLWWAIGEVRALIAP